MRILFRTGLIVAVLWVCAIGMLRPASAQTERIVSFDSRIEVHKNGDMTVTETITVFALGRSIKRGIYREFPTTYKNRLGHTVRVGFEVRKVLRDGAAEPWFVRDTANGKRVYIGRRNAFLSPGGTYAYSLTYRTTRQIGHFKTHDELYWNVTGDRWEFEIEQARATVILPADAKALRHTAYTGPLGARGTKWKAGRDANGNLTFATTESLFPGNGLTIVVAFPKGIVAEPKNWQMFKDFLNDNVSGIVLLAGVLIVIGYYSAVWLLLGRDPPEGVIIPRFRPPKDISPATARYLMEQRFDHKAFTTALMNMAVKGYFSIHRMGPGSYTLKIMKKGASKLSRGERNIANTLSGSGSDIDLDSTNSGTIRAAVVALKNSLRTEFERNHFRRNGKGKIIGIVLSVYVFVVFLGAGGSGWAAGLIVLSAIILVIVNAVFFYLLHALTPKGRRIMEELAGLKMYLTVAETDRIGKARMPEKTPDLFERLLPYAVALGVENQWARKFTEVLKTALTKTGEPWSPSWYRDGREQSSTDIFDPGDLIYDWDSSFSNAVETALTPPAPSASDDIFSGMSWGNGGFSGFGGGGSSGGGGGGGGGGGW